MKRKLAVLAASGLTAVLVGSPAVGQDTAAEAAWVDEMISSMMQREGVTRPNMARLTDTLTRAYQEQRPGEYFDTYSADRVAGVLDAYGEDNLASLLKDWDTSAKTSGKTQNRRQPAPTKASTSSRARLSGSPQASSSAPAKRPDTSDYSDNQFVNHMLRQMKARKSLDRAEAERFESIIIGGTGGESIQRYGRGNVADLLATYGMAEAGQKLNSQEAMASGSASAADRLNSITSASGTPGDYRDEYLAKADQLAPTGVERYDGAVLTVYDENLAPFTLSDPVAGKKTLRSVTSCLYKSSTPQSATPPVSQTMQRMELPGTISAHRFIERTREGEVITHEYRLSKVALDWGDATNINIRAYLFGNIIPPPEQVVRPDGRVVTRRPPPPPPEWLTFTCSPRSVRTG